MSDYESPLEHWSSPGGCSEDCPCADERKHDSDEPVYCCIPLCEWEAVTQRGERHLCAQCAQAFDAGVEYAERTPAHYDRLVKALAPFTILNPLHCPDYAGSIAEAIAALAAAQPK